MLTKNGNDLWHYTWVVTCIFFSYDLCDLVYLSRPCSFSAKVDHKLTFSKMLSWCTMRPLFLTLRDYYTLGKLLNLLWHIKIELTNPQKSLRQVIMNEWNEYDYIAEMSWAWPFLSCLVACEMIKNTFWCSWSLASIRKRVKSHSFMLSVAVKPTASFMCHFYIIDMLYFNTIRCLGVVYVASVKCQIIKKNTSNVLGIVYELHLLYFYQCLEPRRISSWCIVRNERKKKPGEGKILHFISDSVSKNVGTISRFALIIYVIW